MNFPWKMKREFWLHARGACRRMLTEAATTGDVTKRGGNHRSVGRSFQRRTLCCPIENAGRLQDPAHNHPTTEYVTVISGNFHLGMGDKLDEKSGVELTAGWLRRSS